MFGLLSAVGQKHETTKKIRRCTCNVTHGPLYDTNRLSYKVNPHGVICVRSRPHSPLSRYTVPKLD